MEWNCSCLVSFDALQQPKFGKIIFLECGNSKPFFMFGKKLFELSHVLKLSSVTQKDAKIMKTDYLMCSFCLVLVLPLSTAASWALRSFSNLIRSNVRCFDMPVLFIDSESSEDSSKKAYDKEKRSAFYTTAKIQIWQGKLSGITFLPFLKLQKKTWVVGQKHIW